MKNDDAAALIGLALIAGVLLVKLALVIGIIWIAIHFITKFW